MNSIAIIKAVNTTSLPFHGQHLITAMAAGVAYVAMKPIVENIGLDWASQFVKLNKQREKFNCCDITMVAGDSKLRQLLCIPLKKLNGWLFSINPAKVRGDLRERLVRYQEECFTALHDYWTKGAAIRKSETTVDDRTPLRGIVNRIMGKYGMTYQAVYKLVHKEFGVKHIDELTTRQTSEAIEYLAGKVIEGEFIGKGLLPVGSNDFSVVVHNANVVCEHLDVIQEIWRQELRPALILMESPLLARLNDRINDACSVARSTCDGIEKRTGITGFIRELS